MDRHQQSGRSELLFRDAALAQRLEHSRVANGQEREDDSSAVATYDRGRSASGEKGFRHLDVAPGHCHGERRSLTIELKVVRVRTGVEERLDKLLVAASNGEKKDWSNILGRRLWGRSLFEESLGGGDLSREDGGDELPRFRRLG